MFVFAVIYAEKKGTTDVWLMSSIFCPAVIMQAFFSPALT